MSPIEPNIMLKIPDRCYISPVAERPYPFSFYFTLSYGFIPPSLVQKTFKERAELQALKGPKITVKGFERLLKPENLQDFLKDLKKTGDRDWTVDKSLKNEIVFTYVGDGLDRDFWFSASTENFICQAQNNDVVVLQVAVRNFDVADLDYALTSKVDYTPWAKSISFAECPVPLGAKVEVCYEYMGDNVDKVLLQDGVLVSSARSPYTAGIEKPSTFTLQVFNQCGIWDSTQKTIEVHPPEILSFKADRVYFAPGDAVTLTWELNSVSNINIDNLKEGREIIQDGKVVVYPATAPGSISTSYTLRANGFRGEKPASTTAVVTLTRTLWKSAGQATGYFAGMVYDDVNYNCRIISRGGRYYCYAHPHLYKSADGFAWENHCTNTQAPDSFRCIAADAQRDMLYAMGVPDPAGDRLHICRYDFSTGKWTYGPASQHRVSDIGSFCLTAHEQVYAQTAPGGITLALRGEDGGWNAGSTAIPSYEGKKVVSGDYCFFKDRNYAVMLCEDDCIYVYDCSEAMETVLFKRHAGENARFACFLQTLNRLYVLTGAAMIDAGAQKPADAFYPLEKDRAGRPWLGVNGQGNVFGIFPDKKVWSFEEQAGG